MVKLFQDSLPLIDSKIKNEQQFNRDEAENLASYFLLVIRSTVSAQYTDYLKSNHELLQTLREKYNLEK